MLCRQGLAMGAALGAVLSPGQVPLKWDPLHLRMQKRVRSVEHPLLSGGRRMLAHVRRRRFLSMGHAPIGDPRITATPVTAELCGA